MPGPALEQLADRRERLIVDQQIEILAGRDVRQSLEPAQHRMPHAGRLQSAEKPSTPSECGMNRRVAV